MAGWVGKGMCIRESAGLVRVGKGGSVFWMRSLVEVQ